MRRHFPFKFQQVTEGLSVLFTGAALCLLETSDTGVQRGTLHAGAVITLLAQYSAFIDNSFNDRRLLLVPTPVAITVASLNGVIFGGAGLYFPSQMLAAMSNGSVAAYFGWFFIMVSSYFMRLSTAACFALYRRYARRQGPRVPAEAPQAGAAVPRTNMSYARLLLGSRRDDGARVARADN